MNTSTRFTVEDLEELRHLQTCRIHWLQRLRFAKTMVIRAGSLGEHKGTATHWTSPPQEEASGWGGGGGPKNPAKNASSTDIVLNQGEQPHWLIKASANVGQMNSSRRMGENIIITQVSENTGILFKVFRQCGPKIILRVNKESFDSLGKLNEVVASLNLTADNYQAANVPCQYCLEWWIRLTFVYKIHTPRLSHFFESGPIRSSTTVFSTVSLFSFSPEWNTEVLSSVKPSSANSSLKAGFLCSPWQ